MRVKITEYLENEHYFEARAEVLEEKQGDADVVEAMVRSVGAEFERYSKIKKNIPEEALSAVADAV